MDYFGSEKIARRTELARGRKTFPVTPLPPTLHPETPVALPSEPRTPLSVPEGASVTSPPSPPYPDILVALPSEPVVLFLSGYDLFEPDIGLDGFVPPSFPPNLHHNPPLPSSELESFFVSDMSFSKRASVWVGSLTHLPAPPPPSHRTPFASLFFFFRFLNIPSLVRDPLSSH